MKLLELFSGTKSVSKVFKARGHEVYSVDFNEELEPDWCIDILDVTAEMILEKFGQPDVIWASPDCFIEGTLVWTNDGYKPIENIKINDYVLTHLNNYKPVYKIMRKKTNKLCDIKIAGSEIITSTENHPFYVRKKKLVWNNNTRSYCINLEEPEWIEASKLDNTYRVGIPINNKNEIPEWVGTEKHLNNQFGVSTSELENKLSVLLDNKDFWWLIGRYMGDGCYYNKNGKYQFEICCNKNNNETQEIKGVLDRLPEFNYSLSEKYTSNVFVINRKELVEFVEQFGKGAEGKKITNNILNLPKYLLESFLLGYLSADAHFDNKYNCYKITTVSKELAYGLQKCVLKAFGRYCSMTTKEAYIGNIEGRIVNCKKSYTLNFYMGNKHLQYYIEDNYAWVNIKSVSISDKEAFIYNMSVLDDESYTVNNFAVHNCTSYSIAAISHHRFKDEDGNLSPKSDYAKYCDKVNLHVMQLIKDLNPTYYFIENPRGGMRKMNFVKDKPRYTVTYCKYNNPLIQELIFNMKTKKCPKCGEIKEIEEFYKNNSRKDGFSSYCKICSNENHSKYVEDNKEKLREYDKKQYWKSPDKHRENRRKSNIVNTESIKEKREIYYKNNKDMILQKNHEYYNKNKAYVNLRNKKYYCNNKDKFIFKARERKNKLREVSDGSITEKSLYKIYELQKHKCAYCDCNLEESGKHLDHIIPISKGGSHTLNNVHYVCPTCNLSKNNKTEEEWLKKERMKPTDIWTNHPNPSFKPMCKNGDSCHVAAPRGSRTGTQGLKNAKERGVIPQQLCEHICDICEETII